MGVGRVGLVGEPAVPVVHDLDAVPLGRVLRRGQRAGGPAVGMLHAADAHKTLAGQCRRTARPLASQCVESMLQARGMGHAGGLSNSRSGHPLGPPHFHQPRRNLLHAVDVDLLVLVGHGVERCLQAQADPSHARVVSGREQTDDAADVAPLQV